MRGDATFEAMLFRICIGVLATAGVLVVALLIAGLA